MSENKPEKKIRASPVSATVWANEGKSKTGEKVIYRTISIERNYQDKDGKWQSTNSLRINDLPKAALVLQRAYEYLVLKDDDASSDSSSIGDIEEEVVM